MSELTPIPLAPIPFDVIGFDLDGTLLNTAGDLAAALNHALVLAGRQAVSPETALTYVGGGTRIMLTRALDANGGALPEAEFELLLPRLVDYYEAHIAVHTRPYPGMEAMLDALDAQGVKVAVVTNKLEHLARRLLGELDLTDRFYTIIGGDTLGPGRAKPAPDLLHLMVERSGLAAPRVAYVGDTSYDTRAAHAAHLPVVAVSFGFTDAHLPDLGPSAIIDHFDELIPALQGLAIDV
jgi:phosphoglycolate phosphatase